MRTGPSRPLLVAAIVALTTSIASCRTPSPASGQAKRVVSLSPSTTEALAAIGATGLLVGRSRYCDYPPEVTKLPIVGGYTDPSYEAILALAPDLVTGARGPAGIGVVDRLAAQGIATYFPRTESFAGIDEMLRGLGARTGHAREADEVVKRLDADEDAVTRAVAALPKVRVLVLFGLQPIVAAGPGGFADEMVKRAGGDDVVTEGGAYPTLGMERVLALDPDVVLDAAWGEDEGKARLSTESPGWKELRAVKAGRVVTLRDEVVLRPGPRIAEGLRRVAKAIHPEVVLP